MTQKTLTYTATYAGLRAAINQLMDEMQHLTDTPQHINSATPLGMDDELTFEIFKEFETTNPDFKGLGTRVWNVFYDKDKVAHCDESPRYVGNLLQKGIVSSIPGRKSQNFLESFLLAHGLVADSTPEDWVEPDLRKSHPRPENWAAFDVLITKNMVDQFEKLSKDSSLKYRFFYRLLWRLNQSSATFPFARRLWVGHLCHPDFEAFVRAFRIELGHNNPATYASGDQIWAYCMAFISFLQITPASTPSEWTPIDLKD